MTTIPINTDGEMLWYDPFAKLEKIKQAIQPQLESIKKKWDRNEVAQFPRKLEFNTYISQMLALNFRKFPKIPSKKERVASYTLFFKGVLRNTQSKWR
jgi:hypothetical protein